MNNESINLINKISEMNGDNLLEKITDYCETFDKDPQEVGDILAENEEFSQILYTNCIKHHIIKDSKKEIKKDLDLW